jgi:hypothetical protein
MINPRAAAAQRYFRAACFLWVLLLPMGQVLHLPYLQPRWQEAGWELSAGALALFWVGLALWSGTVRLGYRGVGIRTVARLDAPRAFWGNLVIGAATGVLLVAFGAARLMRS